MSLEQARHYLARVVPWPLSGEQSWVNLHWTFVPADLQPGRKPPWTGRAVRDLGQAIKALEYALSKSDVRDIYACLSAQREAQETTVDRRDGSGPFTFHKPVRLAENATSLKSLFLDIDGYKDGPTGYPTLQEAMTALAKFLSDAGLPRPTMNILSGGGIHAYWVFSEAIPVTEWYPLACALIEATKRHGLRCDNGVTTDAARVLRVPDTFNYKQDPKRLVRLGGTPLDFDYTVERLAQALAPYKVANAILPHLNNPLLAVLTPRPAIQEDDDLSAGIETAMPRDEVRECLAAIPNNAEDWARWNTIGMRVYAATDGADYGLEAWQAWSDTLKTKGADSCQERWAAFSGSPPSRTGAGALVVEARTATGDPKWTPRGAILSRLVQQPVQANPAVGALQSVPGGLAQPGNTLVPPAASDLPPGYSRDTQGLVSLIGLDENGATTKTPVCDYPMRDAWLQENPLVLHFETTTGRGRPRQIAIEMEIVNTNDMRRVLQSQGLMVRNLKLIGDFLVSWIQKLQDSRDTVHTSPYGWSVKNGKLNGFIYGGRLWSPTGDTPAANPDMVIFRQYAPSGDLEPWLEAADMITNQGRQDVAAILASAFAAPLVRFTGQPGALMSAYSVESGIGKSTAMKVAQAVWGDPIRAVQSLADTQNSVMNKIGEIRSLPLYWDELKTEEDTRKFVNITFQVTQGKEKSRLTQSAKQRDLGTWQTLLVSASNESLLDHVVSHTATTTAGLYRIFEFTVKPPLPGSQIDPSDAALIVAKLNDNYGFAGLEYSKFLGVHHARVEKEVGEFQKAIGVKLKSRADERFWIALVTCVCMGAKYANELDLTAFDLEALERFMLKSLEAMRGERTAQSVDLKNPVNVSDKLAQFLNAMRTRHTILTNRIHIKQGKPPPGSIKIVQDTSRLDGIYVHVGVDDKMMRISSTALSEWLKEKNYSRHAFTQALIDEFGMKRVNGRIASGTQFAGATEYLLEIDLAGTALTNFIDEA